LVIPDTDDPKRRLFLPAKMNLAEEPTGLAYSLESVDLEGIGPVGRVAWESGPIRMTADDALAAAAADPEDRGARNLAADWLTEVLAAGPMKAAEVKQAAKDAGIAWRTVNRRRSQAPQAGLRTRCRVVLGTVPRPRRINVRHRVPGGQGKPHRFHRKRIECQS
jgi:hypothetical protein